MQLKVATGFGDGRGVQFQQDVLRPETAQEVPGFDGPGVDDNGGLMYGKIAGVVLQDAVFPFIYLTIYCRGSAGFQEGQVSVLVQAPQLWLVLAEHTSHEHTSHDAPGL